MFCKAENKGIYWYFSDNTILSVFFYFRTQTWSCGEGGGRQGGGGVSHIGAWIILSASCSLVLFCFMFKVEDFIVSVHCLEFKRSECTSYYNIACQIQKDPHWKIDENELNTQFLFTDVKAAEVKAAWEKVEVEMSGGWCWGRRGSGRGMWFKALHFRTKFQYLLTG